MQDGRHLLGQMRDPRPRRGEAVNIAAAAEERTIAGEQHGADGGILIALDGGVEQSAGHLGVQRIGRVWAVESDAGQPAFAGKEQRRRAHEQTSWYIIY